MIRQLVLEQGRKVVVFSQWRRMLSLAHWAVGDLLAENGLRAGFFTGAEGQKRRTQNIVEFHDDPRLRLLFASDAGGVGLNLQHASNCVINLELPWNPAVLEQRIGRIYRLGPEAADRRLQPRLRSRASSRGSPASSARSRRSSRGCSTATATPSSSTSRARSWRGSRSSTTRQALDLGPGRRRRRRGHRAGRGRRRPSSTTRSPTPSSRSSRPPTSRDDRVAARAVAGPAARAAGPTSDRDRGRAARRRLARLPRRARPGDVRRLFTPAPDPSRGRRQGRHRGPPRGRLRPQRPVRGDGRVAPVGRQTPGRRTFLIAAGSLSA